MTSKRRKSSHALLDATEKALIRLIKRTEPITIDGATTVESTVNIDDQLEVVLAATKFLATKHKILPDEGDDDDSFLTRAQRRLAGDEPIDGKRPSSRRRRDRARAAAGSATDTSPFDSPSSPNGTGHSAGAENSTTAPTSPVETDDIVDA